MSDYPTQNIELCAAYEKIERLKQRVEFMDTERQLLIWCGIMLVRSTPLRAAEADEIDQLINAIRKNTKESAQEALLSDIQDEAYSEAMAEIERLKDEMGSITYERDEWRAAYNECFQGWKALMTRAADALEGWSQNDTVALPLIAELRKAAE